jgi:hypothetical protein
MKHLSKPSIVRYLSALCVLLLLVTLGIKLAPLVFATSDFTASNLTFDPTTGRMEFDYSGSADLTSSNPTIRIYSTDGITKYWEELGGNTDNCTASHCVATLFPSWNSDSGVTSVIIQATNAKQSQQLNYPLPLPTTNTPQTPIAGGWTGVGETWTYASADSPTFTATVSGDLTGVYAPGMRVKLTQSSTTKYFLITAASYSSPNTTITLYGGTDYTLANSTISKVYFSMQKAPLGFPLDPSKWTVQVSDATSQAQSSPVANTWYNLGSNSITIPIGVWRTYYEVETSILTSNQGAEVVYTTLSTSNNSESDSDFTSALVGSNDSAGSVTNYVSGVETKEKILNLASKTTYYLNTKTDQTGMTEIANKNGYTKMFIRAVSSYL